MLSAPCGQQYEDNADKRGQRAPHSHTFFLLVEPVVYLKISGFWTYRQQLHDGVHPQNWTFSQCVILPQFVSDDTQNFFNWNVSEKANNLKTDEFIWFMNLYRFK